MSAYMLENMVVWPMIFFCSKPQYQLMLVFSNTKNINFKFQKWSVNTKNADFVDINRHLLPSFPCSYEPDEICWGKYLMAFLVPKSHPFPSQIILSHIQTYFSLKIRNDLACMWWSLITTITYLEAHTQNRLVPASTYKIH